MNVTDTPSTLRKTIGSDDRIGVRRTKPVNTSLASIQPKLNTQITANEARQASPAASKHDQLVKQTRVWVSQTFFGAMLKQMRESPFKSEIFDGGRGGQAFSSLFDQHLTDRMARGAGAKLVDSIVRKIEAHAQHEKETPQVDGAEGKVG